MDFRGLKIREHEEFDEQLLDLIICAKKMSEELQSRTMFT